MVNKGVVMTGLVWTDPVGPLWRSDRVKPNVEDGLGCLAIEVGEAGADGMRIGD
jgi:hypothetical protein